MNHNPIREGDEWYCPKCAKRWGVSEDPPKCESAKRKEYLKFIFEKFPVASKGQK